METFRKKPGEYLNITNFSIDTQILHDYSHFYLSDKAVTAYAKCVEAIARKTDGSLNVWIESVDRDVVVGKVY